MGTGGGKTRAEGARLHDGYVRGKGGIEGKTNMIEGEVLSKKGSDEGEIVLASRSRQT